MNHYQSMAALGNTGSLSTLVPHNDRDSQHNYVDYCANFDESIPRVYRSANLLDVACCQVSCDVVYTFRAKMVLVMATVLTTFMSV